MSDNEKLQEQKEKIVKTLATMFDYLGLNASLRIEEKGNRLAVKITSDDAGRIIGRKGQALESLQLLLNRIMFKDNEDCPHILLDIDGYAAALTEFDRWLGTFLPTLGEDDVVMITADHGCDPSYTATTDHTREYVPLLVLGKGVKPGNLGTKPTFADIAATVTDLLGVHWDGAGTSFAGEIL